MLGTLLNVCEGIGWVALAIFSLHCLWLLAVRWRYRRCPSRPLTAFDALPVVTIQLPVFNERYVVRRLLEAVAKLDYPKDRLEIQVLDDSTDDTTELIARHMGALAAQGSRIRHLHRTHRNGFKAGALADGLAAAEGEFVALFDADFVPPPDFLQRTVHFFTDPLVGMVQTRWGHLNRGESFLTRAQALMLDGHFCIEQVARSRGGFFFNFNGSAGIWRTQAIRDAGGWQSDTLTEDLDLSYRAQLKGWRFLYLSDVVVPAELPVTMTSLKIQHHRWTKGSIQSARKLLPAVLRSRAPWLVKVEACFHFWNWLNYPLCILVALLVLPQLMADYATAGVQHGSVWGGLVGVLLLTTTTLFYSVAERESGRPWWVFLFDIPALMAVSVGLALNNSRAIWEAVRGAPSSFHRTPKYNGRYASVRHPGYRTQPSGARWWWTEVALGIYVSVALGYAASRALYTIVPFLLPLSAGFLYAGFSSLAPSGMGPVDVEPPSVAAPLEAVVARAGDLG